MAEKKVPEVWNFFLAHAFMRTTPTMSEKRMQQQSTGQRDGHKTKSDPNKIISMKLRALYNSVEQEGIPDRFLTLLEKLDEAERSQSNPGDDNE